MATITQIYYLTLFFKGNYKRSHSYTWPFSSDKFERWPPLAEPGGAIDTEREGYSPQQESKVTLELLSVFKKMSSFLKNSLILIVILPFYSGISVSHILPIVISLIMHVLLPESNQALLEQCWFDQIIEEQLTSCDLRQLLNCKLCPNTDCPSLAWISNWVNWVNCPIIGHSV